MEKIIYSEFFSEKIINDLQKMIGQEFIQFRVKQGKNNQLGIDSHFNISLSVDEQAKLIFRKDGIYSSWNIQ